MARELKEGVFLGRGQDHGRAVGKAVEHHRAHGDVKELIESEATTRIRSVLSSELEPTR